VLFKPRIHPTATPPAGIISNEIKMEFGMVSNYNAVGNPKA
jgi:hypothetical protein